MAWHAWPAPLTFSPQVWQMPVGRIVLDSGFSSCYADFLTKIFAVLLALLDLLLQLAGQLLDLALRLRGSSRTRRGDAVRQQILGEACSKLARD